MIADRKRNSVLRQLAALRQMTDAQLHEKWYDLYGSKPPRFKRLFFQKRLAYRIQELFYGGLSENTVAKISKLAANDPVALLTNKSETAGKPLCNAGKILPGTRFIREWEGKRYEAVAAEKGFEYNGRNYRSLSGVAFEITGTKWNGFVFWGLRKR